jgi:hypothetical protein
LGIVFRTRVEGRHSVPDPIGGVLFSCHSLAIWVPHANAMEKEPIAIVFFPARFLDPIAVKE